MDVVVDLYVASEYGRTTFATSWFEGRLLFLARNDTEPVGFMLCNPAGALTLAKVGDTWLDLGVAGVLVGAARKRFVSPPLSYAYPVSPDGKCMVKRYDIPLWSEQEPTDDRDWDPSEARRLGEQNWLRLHATGDQALPQQPTQAAWYRGAVKDPEAG